MKEIFLWIDFEFKDILLKLYETHITSRLLVSLKALKDLKVTEE